MDDPNSDVKDIKPSLEADKDTTIEQIENAAIWFISLSLVGLVVLVFYIFLS